MKPKDCPFSTNTSVRSILSFNFLVHKIHEDQVYYVWKNFLGGYLVYSICDKLNFWKCLQGRYFLFLWATVYLFSRKRLMQCQDREGASTKLAVCTDFWRFAQNDSSAFGNFWSQTSIVTVRLCWNPGKLNLLKS